MKLAFIGGGNMASAMIGGLLKSGQRAADISVVEIDMAARRRLTRELGVAVTDALADANEADVIVLATKPQQLREVAVKLVELERTLQGQLVISIAAGIRTRDLSRWLNGHRNIVRVMPNTPALVLAGVSGLFALPEVSAADRARAEHLMRAVGETVWIEHEDAIDAVTAVSGSGPAYVFYFIEALAEAGVEAGLPEATARTLALQTFVGAAKLAAQSAEPAQSLRLRVTSKGGTTERALEVLAEACVKDTIKQAVAAATARGRELGDILGAD